MYPNIEAERAKRRMSLETLAHEVGVCRRTLWLWLKEGKVPDDALNKMSDLFGQSAKHLSKYTREE